MNNKHRDVDLLLDLVNTQPSHKKLLAKFPLQEFVSMQCWPSLQQNLRQQLYLWLFRSCLQSQQLLVKYDNSFVLSIGQLHYLYSGPLSIGYIIEIPRNCHTELTPTYISSIYGKSSIKITAIEDLPTLEHLLNGQHLSVFALGNIQMIASVNKQLVDFIR